MVKLLWTVPLLAALSLPAQNTSKVFDSASRPRALALIGDRYHSPVYIRDGLIKALVRENIPTTFIEEVTELNAASLAEHQLLIILRDGMNWPNGCVLRWQHCQTDKPVCLHCPSLTKWTDRRSPVHWESAMARSEWRCTRLVRS